MKTVNYLLLTSLLVVPAFLQADCDNDITPPEVTCPEDQVELFDENCMALTSDYLSLVTATDDCDPAPVIIQNPLPGTAISGPTLITITATDVSGNSSTCDFTVDVEDDLAPVLSLPSNVSLACGQDDQPPIITCGPIPLIRNGLVVSLSPDGSAMIDAEQFDVGSFDECGTGILKFSFSPVLTDSSRVFNCNDIGTQNLNIYLTDGAGTQTWVNTSAIIQDPIDHCTAGTGCGPQGILRNGLAVNLTDAGTATIIASQFDLASIDGCNSGNLDFSFSTLNSDNSRTFSCADLGTQSVEVWITDGSGNQTFVHTFVVVQDQADLCVQGLGVCSPLLIGETGLIGGLSPNRALTIPVSAFSVFTDDLCTAGNLNLTFSGSTNAATFDCTNLGPQTISLSIEDGAANQTTLESNLIIQDNSQACQGAGFATAVDNCDQFPLVTFVDAITPDNCPQSYTIIRTWTATDVAGNSVSMDQTVTVEDAVAPTVICPAEQQEVLDANCQFVLPDYTLQVTATDNCDQSPSFTQLPLPGTVMSASATITITATDACGNASDCSFDLVLVDEDDPTFNCPGDMEVMLDLNCEYSIPDYSLTIGVNDNCDSQPNYVQNPLSGTSISESTSVGIMVSDASGNSSSCNFTLTPVNTGPYLSAMPADTTVNCIADIPGSQGVEGFDPCEGQIPVFFTQSDLPTACVGQGTVTNSWTAQNSEDQTITYNQVVTIDDQEPPVFTNLPSDTTVNCYDVIPWLEAVLAVDNCGEEINVVFQQTPAPDCLGSGQVIYSYIAIDCSGNSAVHNQFITINDTIPPVLSETPLDMTVSCVSEVPGDQNITASDICGSNIDVIFTQSNEPVCPGNGTMTNTWTATDCAGNVATWMQTITIEDVIDPVFDTMPVDITVDCIEDIPGDQGVTATDNCGETLAALFEQSDLPACADNGTVTNTWTATDCAGNTAVYTQTVSVDHLEDPMFSETPADIIVECAFDVPGDPGITATSYCGETLTVSFNQTAPPACVGNGAIVNTWSATDCAGNTVQYSQFVTIEDTEDPVLSEMPANVSVDCVFDVPGDPGVTATDNCGEVLEVDFSQSGLSTNCPGNGTVTNTWIATDCAGNSVIYVQTITLVDSEMPVFSALPLGVSVTCFDEVPGDPGITATDNCGEQLSVVFSQSTPPDCAGEGQVINTWTVSDCTGNIASQEQLVTITNNVNPILSEKPSDITVACAQDIPGDQGVTATDNCDTNLEVIFTQEGLPLEFPNPDPVLNIWTVIDCAGNETIHTQVVTILDDVDPVAICSGINITLDSNGNATLSADAIGDGSSDNCGIANYLVNNNTFDCSNIGDNDVLLTVVDEFGNTDNCIAIISVIASTACVEPPISNLGGPTISDPCSCRTDGEFDEEIVVGPTGPGQNWEVLTTDLLNPLTLQPIIPGTPLTQYPDGMGQFNYAIAGVHIDGQGYTIEVVSPNFPGVVQSISNTCYYPDPQILNLDGEFCLYSAPQPLVGDVGGVLLDSEVFTINGQLATVFDASQLGVGVHTVTYTVDAGTATSLDPSDPGCVSTVSTQVQVQSTPSGLACNNSITISVDQNCEALVTPDMILEGTYGCYDDYEVTIFLGINNIGNPVTGSNLNQELTAIVTHLVSGNSCSGLITVLDNLAPVFDCPLVPVEVTCTEDISLIPNPIAIDNCTPVEYTLIDEVLVDDDPCTNNTVTIKRTWLATDDYDNTSLLCEQFIDIIRPDDVDFPNDITWECDQYSIYPSITDESPLHPQVEVLQVGINAIDATLISSGSVLSNTGSGIPLDIDGVYCNYGYTHSDQVLGACGNTFQIVRTWTVFDWCAMSVVTSNQAGEDNVQIIHVADVTPPTISLSPFTVSANVQGQHPVPCTSQGFLLPPLVEDNCHDWTISIFTPVGEAIYVNGIDGANGGIIPPPGLSLGFHTIVYQAVDECNNITELGVTIEVVDDIAPTAICDQITEVNLSSNGEAVVPAAIFDDGSFDNCGLSHFEVKRDSDNCDIPGNTQFGPSVIFCCSDISASPISVTIRVYDDFNNFNECTVVVNIDDQLPPIISSCPNPVTINCEVYDSQLAAPLNNGDFSILDQFGAPFFYDNCEVIPNYQVSINIDNCQQGTIVRNWTATDAVGNPSNSCTQTITVEHVSNFAVSFPIDLDIICTDGVLPDFGYPEIFFDECEMVGVSWDDQYFYVVPDACYQIIRTWTVVNWCIYDQFGEDVYSEYNEIEALQDFDGDSDLDDHTFQDGNNDGPEADGYIVYQQVVKVEDMTAPTFTVPAIDGCIVELDCDKDLIIPFPIIEDDCSLEFEVDINGSFGIFNNVTGPITIPDVAPGTYLVSYTVLDNCGNPAYEFITFDVVDCKLPSPVCLSGADIEIMQTGMIEVFAETLNLGSYDNCPGDLIFSFSADVTDISNVYTCDDIGFQPVEIWVTDASGNQDYCETFVVIQDNMDVCNEADIAGQISTEDDDMIANVMVSVNGGMFNQLTNSEGEYLFTLPIGEDYTVSPFLDASAGNGVSTLDMLYIQQHILGLQFLDSPYKMIAADANNTQSITTLDLLAIQKVILGLETSFPNNTSWRFVEEAYIFPQPTNPWFEPFPEVINFNNLPSDQLAANFIGVKIGDIDLSATTNADGPPDQRSFREEKLILPNNLLSPGKSHLVPIRLADNGMMGCQFTLGLNLEKMESYTIIPGMLEEHEMGWFKAEGLVTASWSTLSAFAEKDLILFYLEVVPNQAVYPIDFIRLEMLPTKPEAYNDALEIRDLVLSFESDKKADQLILYSAYPNPSNGTSKLRFYLPKAGIVQLRLTDLTGRVIREDFNKKLNKGFQEIILNDLPSGVLVFSISGPGGQISGKLIVE